MAVVVNAAGALLNLRLQLLRTLKDGGHDVVACAPGESSEVRRALASKGIDYCPIELDRFGVSLVSEAKALLSVANAFRLLKPDAVLAYTIKPIVYATVAARMRGTTKVFSTLTGLPGFFDDRTWRGRALAGLATQLLRLTLPLNEAVLFQNADDVEMLRRLGALRWVHNTVVVNGSGVDVEHFRPMPLPSNGPRFLLAARLIPSKGIREFVRAATLLTTECPSAYFGILGRADVQGGIPPHEIASWKAGGVVDVLDAVKDVRPAIGGASVCVLPSYREGVPRFILEGMAMGRPAIVTDAPGCRDPVENGVNGFVIPSRSVEALAEAMRRFVAKPEILAPMGARSRAIAVERYDVRRVNAEIMRAMRLE